VRVDVGLGSRHGLGSSNMVTTAKPAAGPLYGREVPCLRVTFLQTNFCLTPNSILNLTISYESHAFIEFHAAFCVGKYCQLFTHESIIDQYAIFAFYSPPNCPFPFDDCHQNLIHGFRARHHSPPQTSSGSNQPFCHNTHVRTDTWDKRLARIT